MSPPRGAESMARLHFRVCCFPDAMRREALLRRAGIIPNTQTVMAGLDPAIHPLGKILCQGWMLGSGPRMTSVELATAPGSAAHHAAKMRRAALRPGNGASY